MRIFRRGESGASAVEFGLVLPLLVVILLGLIDYGWVFFVRLNMTNAAREGARVGVTRSDPGAAETDAESIATAYLQAANLTASVDADPVVPGPNAAVRVTVTVDPFNPLVGFVPTPPNMTVSAQMRWELAEPSP